MNDIGNDGKLLEFITSVDAQSIKVTFCELIDEKSSVWNFEKHSHNFIELIYLLDGKAWINVMDKSIELSLFEMLIYPPGVMHQEYIDMKYHQEIICINIECKCGFVPDVSFKLKDADGEFKWIVNKIHYEFMSRKSYTDDILIEYFKLLFILIKRYILEGNTQKIDAFGKCIQYINDHFNENLSVEKLSHIAFVSPSYLTRIFKKRVGTTPKNYLNIYRIEIAKKLLTLTESSIQETAELVGIQDSKHFDKVFKKVTGCTPLKYRKENMLKHMP